MPFFYRTSIKLINLLAFLSSISFAQLSDFGLGSHYTGNKDFIEVSYGIGKIESKRVQTSFLDMSQSEIIIGRRYLKPIANYRLIEFSDNYIFSSYNNDYESQSNEKVKLRFDNWKFGFGYRKGYAYRIGDIAIMPYYHMGMVWNKINLDLPHENNPIMSVDEVRYLRNYEDQIKFGTANTGGIDLRLSSTIGIGASYETSVIFPYHKFWKQAAGFFVETFAQTGIDFLTEGVLVKAIPEVTPILYFILKNGLSYYIFTLKKDDMNWPFKTVAPLTQEIAKISLKVSL